MFHIRLCLFVCVNLFLYAKCSTPVERLCVNPDCNEPISKAQGSVKYAPPAKEFLGFNPRQEILITSKNKNGDGYWGAVINGKTGYVPSNLVKEVKIFHTTDTLITVPVDLPQSNNPTVANSLENNTLDEIPTKQDNPQKPTTAEPVVNIQNNLNTIEKPIKPDKSFEIIEGTTIYANEPDITPSATVDVKSTSQTIVHSDEKLKKGTEERATIPPEIIELNANYKKSGSNVTVESLKENDDSSKVESRDIDNEDEDEEGDDEEEEDDDGEEDEEEEVIENQSGVNQVQPDVKGSEKEEMVGASSGSVLSESVVFVESSVTSQVSVGDGKMQPPAVSSPPSAMPSPLPAVPSPPPVIPSPPPAMVAASADVSSPPSAVVAASADVSSPPSPVVAASPDLSSSPPPVVAAAPDVSSPPPAVVAASPDVSSPPPPVVAASPDVSSPPPAVVAASPDVPSPPPLDVKVEIPQNTQNRWSMLNGFTEPDGNVPIQQPNIDVKYPMPQAVMSEFVKESQPAAVTTQSESEKPNTAPVEALEPQTTVGSASEAVTEPESLAPQSVQQAGVTTPVEVTEEVATTPHSIPPESSTIFNQFSVSADTLNQPEVVEKVEITTESIATTPQPLTEQPLVPEKVESVSPETTESPSVPTAEEPGMMSQITGMISGWFTSPPKEEEEVPVESAFDTQHVEAPSGTCQSPEFGSDCKDFVNPEEESSWSSWIPTGLPGDGILTQNNTFLYLVVTAVTVLVFTLGHNLIEKKGKTGPLIAKINKLEHELLVSTKECALLKDEIQNVKEKIILYENSANDELVVSLQTELEESKRIRSELESSIEVLQQELDAATEAGLDLNKMLSEVLTQKGGSESLLKSVENLQAQLDSQQKVIDEMTKKLGVKNEENEALQSALDAANEKTENLEEQLTDIKHNLNIHLKEKEDLTRDLNGQISQLKARINQLGETKEKEIEKLRKELEETEKKLKETSGALTVKEEEVKSLKKSMKHLKTKGDVKMETVFDVSRIQAELAKEVKENRSLLEKLQKEESSKKALAEQVKVLDEEMKKLKKGFEEAEQKKDEAEKKLEVLSNYFKEKETQLQKELGLQEALWAQKKGDEKAVYNMMKSLQEEVESYKSQNETLKQEILDQERALKNQMATFEQKAYENWVAARQAERKLEETKQEMSQLRNRLTIVEKNSNNIDGKGNIRSEELNGVEAASPILHDTSSPLLFPPPLSLDPNNSNLLPPGFLPPPMFMPPPLGGFIPPPPFLPGDRRPPPLGRMSSPPLNNRFSPSSPPDYPFERMPSPPLSPNYR